MPPAVQSMVPSTYVRDIAISRSFYQLLGFHEDSAGTADTAAWSYLQHNGQAVLLASTRPPLGIPPLPLLFYFFYDDLDAVVGIVRAAGVEAVHMGHPPHALGGEVKLHDPDGNTILLGQKERSASQPEAVDDVPSRWFSLLREAAILVEASGGTIATCQVRKIGGMSCQEKADIKVADSGGQAAWACLPHAEEILLSVPGAFIASQGDQGIAGFLSRRR